MREKPRIGLLDCNNFYVSCERVFRPDWRTKPVVVLSSNDGCVIARSKEIKDKGIPMGVPYFQIKDSLKDMGAIVCSANLALYRDLSRRVFQLMRQHLDCVEQYSIDEAFFVIPSDVDPYAFAEQLRIDVAQALGLPVSIGIGQSKTQAKFANRQTKLTGTVTAWDADCPPVPLHEIPLHQIWGVGRGMSTQFRAAGLLTVADILAVPADRLHARFGVVATALQAELAGISTSPVSVHQAVPQKSIMSSRTFAKASTDYHVVADALSYHINQIGTDLRALQRGATYLKIWVRPSRFSDYAAHGIRAEHQFMQPEADTRALLALALRLLSQHFVPDIPYRKVGVMVAGLMSCSGQQSLFTPTSDSSQLWSVIDALNQNGSAGRIWLGTLPAQARWKPRQESRMPSYTTQWSDVPVAHAR